MCVFFCTFAMQIVPIGYFTNYLTPRAYERAKSNIVYLARDLPLFG